MALEHQVMVRLDTETFEAVQQLANLEDRAASYIIRRAVKEHVAQKSKKSEFGGGVNRDAVRAMVRQKKEREASPNFKKAGKK
jgi:predicted transcriptional regulator